MKDTSVPPSPLHTAVLFLVFNRPDTTALVFESIRNAKPPRLFVAADGPREGRAGESERVAQVREIATAVDWPCEVKTLFRDVNLGCKEAVSSAITWFFKQEEQGIVLEDDCLPCPDFFSFCETMLNHYAETENVWVITGDNFQGGMKRGDSSYYFSRYNHVWGWATWRRAWKYYDGDLTFWPYWKHSDDWVAKLPDKVERRYWSRIFTQMYNKEIDTWDYPWTATVWYHGALTVTPNMNLVSNIGFGVDATHTTSANHPLAGLPAHPLGDELRHPALVESDQAADRFAFDHVFDGRYQRFPWSLLRLPRRAGGFVYRRLKRGFA